jgi:Mrp family chromosome partitioning ATPase
MRRMGNLFFLTSGGISENPIELLSLRKMKDLIEKLKLDFDTVILDALRFLRLPTPASFQGSVTV